MHGGAVRLRTLLIDAWSWLNYKPVMADPERPGHRVFAELAGLWVPDDDMRRLTAYKLLAAYDSNQAGQLAAATGDHKGLDRRELGDASKLIDTALGYLLGSEQSIVVPGAEHADDDPPPGAARAAQLQEDLREWAEKELLPLRIQQAERSAVRGGDGIYTLAWEPSKERVLLRTYDPGFYFPEWDEGEQDSAEYPQRVHFAWELPADPRNDILLPLVVGVLVVLAENNRAALDLRLLCRSGRRFVAAGWPMDDPPVLSRVRGPWRPRWDDRHLAAAAVRYRVHSGCCRRLVRRPDRDAGVRLCPASLMSAVDVRSFLIRRIGHRAMRSACGLPPRGRVVLESRKTLLARVAAMPCTADRPADGARSGGTPSPPGRRRCCRWRGRRHGRRGRQ